MRTALIFVMALWLGSGRAQEVLDAYVSEGLESNLVLKQRNVSLEKATYALREAQGLFLPTVALQAGYQTADGGRNIPLPIGDLLNPVYRTLNELTGSGSFPEIDNETINFLPRNYYDAHIRTTLPLINTDIRANKQIQEQQLKLSELDVAVYKRELVKDIKVAYFNYLSALRAADVYRSALEVAKEGQRTNQKLVEAGKGLPAYVLRSNGEVAEAEAKLTEAEANARNAQGYFNSLLNRPEATEVDTAFDQETALLQAAAAMQQDSATGAGREELRSLSTAIDIRSTMLKMNRQFAVPKLNAFLDLGSQSEGFRFNGQTRYYLAGLQLEFPIFSGNRNKYKVAQSHLDFENAQLQLAQAEQQLKLANSVAYRNLRSAWKSYQSARSQLEAAQAYRRLITKGYQAGSNSYIETVDARNQYTTAQMAVWVSTYQVLSAAANLEREQASYLLTR